MGDALGTEDFGFIFNLDSDLIAPFNAAIESMKADGYLDYLNTKWFFLTDTTGADLYDSLPDLAGREIVAVTGNDYIPLNFVDPKSGEADGLGIRRGRRDLPPPQLCGRIGTSPPGTP